MVEAVAAVVVAGAGDPRLPLSKLAEVVEIRDVEDRPRSAVGKEVVAAAVATVRRRPWKLDCS